MSIHSNKEKKEQSRASNTTQGGRTMMPSETWNGTKIPTLGGSALPPTSCGGIKIPCLGGSAMPMQRQETVAQEPVVAAAAVLTDEQITSALSYNNAPENYGQNAQVTGGFRVDWVRNMQRGLISAGHIPAGTALSNDGSIDQETVLGIARFQGEGADGKIGRITRTALEAAYPDLQSQLIGEFRGEDILVPAASTEEAKYDYFRSVIEGDGGGAFASGAMEINMLGIRGVQYDEDGNIVQTGSAQAYHDLYEAGRGAGSDHFGWSGEYDDILVTLWVEADNTKRASVRIGSVDPKSNAGGSIGAAHLRDGQYMYGLDQHTTTADGHQTTLSTLNDSLDNDADRELLDLRGGGGTYDALRANGPIEVYRDGGNRFISQTEAANSEDNIRRRHHKYVNDQYIDINIHIGGQEQAHSAGCQNVRQDQYIDHMREINDASNNDDFHYSLIDASKISRSMAAARASSNTPPVVE